MIEWMNEWMNEWMDEWMMNEWMPQLYPRLWEPPRYVPPLCSLGWTLQEQLLLIHCIFIILKKFRHKMQRVTLAKCILFSYSSFQLILLRFLFFKCKHIFLSQSLVHGLVVTVIKVLPMETSFWITLGSISFGGQGLGGVFFFFVFITRKKVKIICTKRIKIDLFVNRFKKKKRKSRQ